jgi:hypothetical protein
MLSLNRSNGLPFPIRLLKNVFYVILNEEKDLNLVEKNRFFATLRMTNRDFCNFSTASGAGRIAQNSRAASP